MLFTFNKEVSNYLLTQGIICKFAAYQSVTLEKLYSSTDEPLGIFQNFSDQLFLRKIPHD